MPPSQGDWEGQADDKSPFYPVLSTMPVWPAALFHLPGQRPPAPEMEPQPGSGKGLSGLRASSGVWVQWRLASAGSLKAASCIVGKSSVIHP